MIAILKQLFPKALPGWIEAISIELPKSSIDTPEEMATFFATLNQESAGLTVFEENLNYSAEALARVWPRHFYLGTPEPDKANAVEYGRQPRKIAEYIYGIRLASKLGNKTPADGWDHRGMGPIQLTGLANQTRCGTVIGYDLVRRPQYLLMPVPGVKSAIWFWSVNGLDALDDDEDIRPETKRVNGGEHGLKQRQDFMDFALPILRGMYGGTGILRKAG